jgi:hypothetical protein
MPEPPVVATEVPPQITEVAKLARRAVEAEAPEARVESTFQALKLLLELATFPPLIQEGSLKIIRDELEEGLKSHK